MGGFSNGSVISADGTRIGYRKIGSGPGLVLIHGGMMASQNFTRLAELLSDAFTVYVPDRRGRGMSGPSGDGYGMTRECEDLLALLDESGASRVFGLSSGALIVLQAALKLPAIRKAALYEPPLPLPDGPWPLSWAPRYERELAQGRVAEAFVSVLKGTGDAGLFTALPRFVLVPMIKAAAREDARNPLRDAAPLADLIPTMRYDIRLVREMENALETFKGVAGEVLLLGGTRSQFFLRIALDRLQDTLPHVQRVDFAGLGHTAADNGGKPERVAEELRRFFLAD